MVLNIFSTMAVKVVMLCMFKEIFNRHFTLSSATELEKVYSIFSCNQLVLSNKSC